MRAAEFMRALADVIDALDGENSATTSSQDDQELLDNPVMMSPHQQQIELQKSEQGKSNPAIEKLLRSNDIGEEGINADPQHIGDGSDAREMDKRGNNPLAYMGSNTGAR